MGAGPYVETPEDKLAKLMNEDLGTSVSGREVRMFVRANWKKISALSHAIHGTDGQRRAPEGEPVDQ